MIIILLGPPGSGKDTQAKLLSQKFNLPHLSIGQLLRSEWEKGTKLGKQGQKYWGERGVNVPTRISWAILLKYIANSFILDNFPRTGENLKYLKNYIAKNRLEIDFVFHLNVDKKEGEKRLLKRAYLEKRPDETRQLIRIRREEGYEPYIKEIKDYFQSLGVWHEIDGNLPIGDVHKNILKIIVS